MRELVFENKSHSFMVRRERNERHGLGVGGGEGLPGKGWLVGVETRAAQYHCD